MGDIRYGDNKIKGSTASSNVRPCNFYGKNPNGTSVLIFCHRLKNALQGNVLEKGDDSAENYAEEPGKRAAFNSADNTEECYEEREDCDSFFKLDCRRAGNKTDDSADKGDKSVAKLLVCILSCSCIFIISYVVQISGISVHIYLRILQDEIKSILNSEKLASNLLCFSFCDVIIAPKMELVNTFCIKIRKIFQNTEKVLKNPFTKRKNRAIIIPQEEN